MKCCADAIAVLLLLPVLAAAEGAHDAAVALYRQGNLRGALQVSLEGLATAPGDERLGRLQRLVLDDMLADKHARLFEASAEIRRLSLGRTIDVKNALEDCRRGYFAFHAGDGDLARTLYLRAREVLPRHSCWRTGLEGLGELVDEAPASPRRERKAARPRSAASVKAPTALPTEQAVAPKEDDPDGAERAYVDGLASYLRGDKHEARSRLEEALRRNPSHPRAKNLLERVRREDRP